MINAGLTEKQAEDFNTNAQNQEITQRIMISMLTKNEREILEIAINEKITYLSIFNRLIEYRDFLDALMEMTEATLARLVLVSEKRGNHEH